MQNAGRLVSRRNLFTGIVAAPILAVAAAPTMARAEGIDATAARAKAALKDAKGTKLVLLGTGSGPLPGLARRMASNLMVHNGAAYVLDCGLGITDGYARTGIPFSALRSIFITHHHPDHNIEYGPLLIIGWISGMRQSVRAYGPPPFMQITADYFRSAKPTIDFWAEDFHLAPLQMIEVHEISSSGPVMQDDNVKVTSVLVQHPPVAPALGYRFDFPDRSIAFSGDTIAVEDVARLAKGGRCSGSRRDGFSCHRGVRATADCRWRDGKAGGRNGSHARGPHLGRRRGAGRPGRRCENACTLTYRPAVRKRRIMAGCCG